MMPLIEKVREKQGYTAKFLSNINKFIIQIGLTEGLFDAGKLESANRKEMFKNEISFEDCLPKDIVVELQQIQTEMKLGLEDREGAMKRLGRMNIQQRLKEIDADRKEHPDIYGIVLDAQGNPTTTQQKGLDQMQRPLGENKAGNDAQVNAGLQNSPEKKAQTNS
jgi:hypothetical protein